MDTLLPQSVRSIILIMLDIVSAIFVIIYTTPEFGIAIIPLSIVYAFVFVSCFIL
jgi:hypothetical protein